MNSEDSLFLFRWLARIGAHQTSKTAVIELKHAILHLDAAQVFTGNKFPLNYDNLRTNIRQMIAIIETGLEPPENQKQDYCDRLPEKQRDRMSENHQVIKHENLTIGFTALAYFLYPCDRRHHK